MYKHSSDIGLVRLPKIAFHLRFNIVSVEAGFPDKILLITSEYDKRYYRVYPISKLGEILLSAIDGETDTTQLIRKITYSSEYKHEEIATLINILSVADIIISGRYDMTDGQAAFWLNIGFTPAFVEHTLSHCQVTVVNGAKSSVCQQTLNTMLNSFGIVTNKDKTHGSNLTVVMVDDYLQESLEEINQNYLKKKTKWMAVKLNGNTHWAGPVFNGSANTVNSGPLLTRPYMAKNFCWNCLAERIRETRQLEQTLYRQTGYKPTSATEMCSPALQASSYSIALEIAKYLLYAEQRTESTDSKLSASLWVGDQITGQTDWYIVNKNPMCVVCEQLSIRGTSPVRLDDPEKGVRYISSGWRTVSPEQTFEDYCHLNNPYTGITDQLVPVENPVGDSCYVYESDNNTATQNDEIFMSLISIKMRNAGKGTTFSAARTGALCESIERYSSSLNNTVIRKHARYQDFPAGQALMPNCFMNFSDQQLKQRQQFNQKARNNVFVNIPNPLAEYEYCEWSPIWSVNDSQTVWTPSQLLYFGYPYKGHWIANPDTNGVAAGNTLTEAFVQAFLEVLERDAVSIWWYNQLQCAELVLSSVNISFVDRVVEQYQRINRRCWVLDISFDLDVNIFVFLSCKNSCTEGSEEESGEICLGIAAHFDPEIALTRAICEHDQLWTMIEKRREGTVFKDLSPEFSIWLQEATTTAQAFNYLLPKGKRQWKEYPQNQDFNLLQQRQACLDMVEKNGWRLYLADFTRPSIGLSVIRVLIPELRSMHRRLGAGRLYEVPVKSGWLKKVRTEDEMNKQDVFV